MDLCVRYYLLTLENQSIYYTSEKPMLICLLMLCDLERGGYISFEEGIKVIKDSNDYRQSLLDTIREKGLCDIGQVVDYYLRQLSMKEIKGLVQSLQDYCVDNNYLKVTKGLFGKVKFDVLCEEELLNMEVDKVLFECMRVTSDKSKAYKEKYKKYVCESEPNGNFETYMVKNIALIKAHIINLVAN